MSPMQGAYGAYPGARGGPRAEEKPSRSLWVGNVNPDAAEQELQAIFHQYGPIENIKVGHPSLGGVSLARMLTVKPPPDDYTQKLCFCCLRRSRFGRRGVQRSRAPAALP